MRARDTEPRSPYRYEVELDNRLESVANAHTGRFAHPPRFLNRAGLKIRGRRERS